MKIDTEYVPVNNGKYAIKFNNSTGELDLYRHDELWAASPKYSNMLISIMYELQSLRSLVKHMKMGSEFEYEDILDMIAKHEENYGECK